MKFVLAFVALALVAAVNAMPTTTFLDQGMGGVEDVQIAARKIGFADADLEALEIKLMGLDAAGAAIESAATVETTAMDTDGYATADDFVHTA